MSFKSILLFVGFLLLLLIILHASPRKVLEDIQSQSIYVNETIGDGNCLFRALSYSLYKTQEYHEYLREKIVNYLIRSRVQNKLNESWFSEDANGLNYYDFYNIKMRENGTYGDYYCILAAVQILKQDICVINGNIMTAFRYCPNKLIPSLEVLKHGWRKELKGIVLKYDNEHYETVITII